MPGTILAEPDWSEIFKASPNPAAEVANAQCREVASEEWQRVVPVLEIAAGIGEVDHATVRDLCVCVARIDQAERDLSERGLISQCSTGPNSLGTSESSGSHRAPELQSPHQISTTSSRTCGTDLPATRASYLTFVGPVRGSLCFQAAWCSVSGAEDFSMSGRARDWRRMAHPAIWHPVRSSQRVRLKSASPHTINKVHIFEASLCNSPGHFFPFSDHSALSIWDIGPIDTADRLARINRLPRDSVKGADFRN